MTTTAAAAQVMSASNRAFEERRRTADRVFRGALLFNAALTTFWLVVLLTREDALFYRDYKVDSAALIRVAQGIVFFNILWGFIWYGVKSLLLKYVAGFSKDERRQTFSSRMDVPYDVTSFLARHSERKIA